ncbi:uncharacterized protein LOC105835508 isoform X2 [Monomorium pharaonis]|uniref:uncharacterized protein LOC105835508 isoform X2 n=1 Tax=Monomorium pharaonis TaxID=307658 RepID=UPI00102E1649|nr:uncharacterized protein LOC105835508 isoform X2 [Monomorium pharaonis]XP_028048022.1 uncharacterized protein LOC105835508 isoform X2 [Monomorium pharaonis]
MDESPKLFRLPGTTEEEEKEEQQRETKDNAVESLLLNQKGVSSLSTLPRNVTLIRVNTQSSSIGGIGRQDSTRNRYRAGPTRKLRRRAVLKNGDCNVLQSRISRRSLRFLQDIFTTLVDTQWRWTLLCFILSFLLSWLGFAVIWWLIAFTHGDFEERHLPPFQVENNWTPCVYNIFSFTSCFLFSIETQHTIGYGSRSTTEECPEAIFIMCLQSISGVMIQAFMVGIVFAKMTRPKQRTQTLLFSRNAVICQRDGELCLMFRVGDMRKSHIIGASVRAQMIRNKTTKEGEILSQHQHELVVGTDGENGDLFFIWPTTIIHRINESSPFFNMSAEDMLTERFEVVLILEGTIESTGQTTQARTSYLPQEILWGHRFDHMVSYSKERQGYEVDYSLFNSTTQVDTPLCSGRELAEFYKAQDDLHNGTGVLIDDNHLMRRECNCNCHLTNHQCLQLPLNSTESHNGMENKNYWQNICKCSNCISYKPPFESIDQSKFDFNTIKKTKNEELHQLPAAANKEIVKNSQMIVSEEEEKISDRNLIRLNDTKNKLLSYNQEIFEKGEDIWIPRAVEKNVIEYFVRTKNKNANSIRNITILERDQEALQQIPKYLMVSSNHLNDNSIFSQQLNYDFLKWKNDNSQEKQYDSIRIVNEKTMRKSSPHYLVKIAMQNKLHSIDNCSLVSSIYDPLLESGFCEVSSNNNCRELFTQSILKNIETMDPVESTNLSQENTDNIDNRKDCIKDHRVETIISINDNIKNNKTIASSYFNTSFKNSISNKII